MPVPLIIPHAFKQMHILQNNVKSDIMVLYVKHVIKIMLKMVGQNVLHVIQKI